MTNERVTGRFAGSGDDLKHAFGNPCLARELGALYESFSRGAASPLPERPDYERANAFLIEARRAMVDA